MHPTLTRFAPAGAVALLALAAVMLVGRAAPNARGQSTPTAEQEVALPLGKQATVHVRRDMLAGEPLLPIAPTDDRVRGAEISVRGVLRSMDADWIVLERDRNFAYVPRKSVLVMEVNK